MFLSEVRFKMPSGARPARAFAPVLFAALLMISGCGGSGIPENDLALLDSGRPSQAVSQARNSYVEDRLRPAIESKDMDRITGLFSPEFIRGRFYVETLLGILSMVNDPSFEVIKSVASVPEADRQYSSPSSQVPVRLAVHYRLKGYCGLAFDEFSKSGLMVFQLGSSQAQPGALSGLPDFTLIHGDDFSSYYHLAGHVLDEEGSPLGFAKVSVSTKTFAYSTTTFANGYFSIEYIDEPSVTVTVEKAGCKPQKRFVNRLEKGSILELAGVRLAREAEAAASGDSLEATLAAAPKKTQFDGVLSALAYNAEVRLFWEASDPVQAAGNTYVIWRRSPADPDFVRIGETSGACRYEDSGLSNGSTYIYRVEVVPKVFAAAGNFSNAAGRVFMGPVMAVPSSFTVRMEFEKLLEGAMKWKGEKPAVLSDKKFSEGAYISFNPKLTSSLSFLTPVKVKSGEYRIFLYARRTKRTMPVRITIKQFGDTEDNYYMSKTVDLRAFSAGETRDIIDLGKIRIDSTNWKNEKIEEDFSDIAISVVYPEAEKASGEAAVQAASSADQPSVALDLIEMIKAD